MNTLLIDEQECRIKVTLNRGDKQNAISSMLLSELKELLIYAESKPNCHFIIIEGQKGIFCSGMDLQEYLDLSQDRDKMHAWTTLYMATLKQLRLSSKLIITALEGKVIAGGTGLVAASDFVIATPDTTFKLTEALWGLIPAMVAPFLIRRIGIQPSYLMALTSKTIKADQALEMHLIDSLVENIDAGLIELLKRLERISAPSIKNIKGYFSQWNIHEEEESLAIEQTLQRMLDPEVQKTIRNFVEHQKLPWQTNSSSC